MGGLLTEGLGISSTLVVIGGGPESAYSESWQLQLDYLAQLFAAETHSGGRLAGIAIEQINPPMGTVFPILAYEYSDTQETWANNAGGRYQDNVFNISLTLQNEFDPQNPQNTDVERVAKAAAMNLWNDRSGNGLGPVLRSDPTMGGLAVYSIPKHVQILVGRSVTDEAVTSGLVLCTFVARGELDVF